MKKNSIKIGMAQMLVEGGESDRNMKRAAEKIEEAHIQGCDLVLLPETMDLAWTHPSVYDEAEPIPGQRSQMLADLAKKFKIYICAGLTEREGDKHYNTALLINDQGEIMLKYRKINLLEVEFPYYEVGKQLAVVDSPWGWLGLNICADNYADGIHLGHALARMGAQILLSPSSWTVDYLVDETQDPYKDKWFKPYHHLADLYDMVIVSTTSVGYIVGGPYEGKKMIGSSLAVNKQGILCKGELNEFAGVLKVVEFQIPHRSEKGTQIGKRLKDRGYQFI